LRPNLSFNLSPAIDPEVLIVFLAVLFIVDDHHFLTYDVSLRYDYA
jgi:hypothetical protein